MQSNPRTPRFSESADALHIAYPTADRVGLALLSLIGAAILAVSHYLWQTTHASLFSNNNWVVIPICLLGDAGLIAFVLWSGSLKSTVSIRTDGAVQEGIGRWKFPGVMTALVVKTGGPRSAHRWWIDLRYGQATVRLPGDTTEGQTIGMSAQINQWCQHRVQGVADPFDVRETKLAISWSHYLSVFAFIALLISVASAGQNIYLNAQAKPAVWAKVSVAIFALSVGGAAAVRWAAFAKAGVRRGAGIVLAEVAIALLLILGGGAIVAHSVQRLEVSVTPGVVTTFDAPLSSTATTQGKGCHRYVVFDDPLVGGAIRYCDPYPLEYWSRSTRVRVTQSQNDIGVHILSVDRATPR